MLEHDVELLVILDEKQMSLEQSSLFTALDLQQLLATAENLNFDQMMVEIVQVPANFQDGVDFNVSVASVLGGFSLPCGSTTRPAGGSPLDARQVPMCFLRQDTLSIS